MDGRNKRIAKNTILLYVRMFFLLAIGLYSTRLVLGALGVEDYGIYNIVGGIVVMFQFFNNAFGAGVQRYLNYYLGVGDIKVLRIIFSQSFYVFAGLGFIIFLLSETIGIIILKYYVTIPYARADIAWIVYQISVITAVLGAVSIPFNSTIIAYERMSFFAKTSVFVATIRLCLIFLLLLDGFDKLLLFAFFTLFLQIVNFGLIFLYCLRNFEIVSFALCREKKYLSGILSFSGWNVLGTLAGFMCRHGTNLLLNHYFGVVANAAYGIANQVFGHVYQYLSNLQIAYNPQIVQSYAKKDFEYLERLVFRASKFSYLLMWFLILPFMVNCDFVLHLWLKTVPHDAVMFVNLFMMFILLDAVASPLWILVEAEGNIKFYQLVGTVSNILTFTFIYVGYEYFNMPAYSGIFWLVVSNFLFMLFRFWYLHNRIGFPVVRYIKMVVYPLTILTALSAFGTIYIHNLIAGNISAFFLSCVFSVISIFWLGYLFVLTVEERNMVVNIVKSKIKV